MTAPGESSRFPSWLAPALLGAVLATAGIVLLKNYEPFPSTEMAQDATPAPPRESLSPNRSESAGGTGEASRSTPEPARSESPPQPPSSGPAQADTKAPLATPPLAHEDATSSSVADKGASSEHPTGAEQPGQNATGPLVLSGAAPTHPSAPGARSQEDAGKAPIEDGGGVSLRPSPSAQAQEDVGKPPVLSDGRPPEPSAPDVEAPKEPIASERASSEHPPRSAQSTPDAANAPDLADGAPMQRPSPGVPSGEAAATSPVQTDAASPKQLPRVDDDSGASQRVAPRTTADEGVAKPPLQSDAAPSQQSPTNAQVRGDGGKPHLEGFGDAPMRPAPGNESQAEAVNPPVLKDGLTTQPQAPDIQAPKTAAKAPVQSEGAARAPTPVARVSRGSLPWRAARREPGLCPVVQVDPQILLPRISIGRLGQRPRAAFKSPLRGTPAPTWRRFPSERYLRE